MLSESKKPSDVIRLEKIKSNLIFRSKFLRELRSFFLTSNFLELETPIMVKAPAPENYINAPQAGDYFLRTSPELHMKKLMTAGFEKIFQVGQCFRAGEIGVLHNVEFSMLEWYEAGKDYNDTLALTKKMLLGTVKKSTGSTVVNFRGNQIDFEEPWEVYTVREAFRKFAKTSPEQAIKDGNFEIILTEKIEPSLPKDKPVILKDYPVSMAALSKVHRNDKTLAERWELYLGGIEIANAYSELTDPIEQRRRFDEAHEFRRKANLPEYPDDSDFFAALEYGMKPYTGIALGIDRLVMVLTDASCIKDVVTFTE